MTQDMLTGYFVYLDRLQKLAIISDMHASAFFLEARFLLDSVEAESILRAWEDHCPSPFLTAASMSSPANAASS